MFTIVDVVIEADPRSFQLLRDRVQALARKEDPKIRGVPSFVRLKQIDQLHFMSLQIFQDRHFDPLLVFENNFDGNCESYWNQVLQQIGDDLRSIFACTKPANESRWLSLFEDGSTLSLKPFIKAYSVAPSASHVGAVGMTRDRIKRDSTVFGTVQSVLGVAAPDIRALKPAKVHAILRERLLVQYPSLLTAGRSRTTKQERSSYKRAALWSILPSVSGILILAAGLGIICWSSFLPDHRFLAARYVVLSFIPAAVLGVAFFWVTLRHLEASDMTQDDPELDPAQLAEFAAQEDQIVQNHVASMVLVKPGVVRSIVIRVSLRLLRDLVPLIAADGYLGAMRTIHFAHWTLVGNSGRLMFLSNFDGSWQSYLDDFVDKAHRGLTLAWGNCIGFPRTRNLISEGATHGREFKAWARQSQTQSILWFSGYENMTVNQILRNAGIVAWPVIVKTNHIDSKARTNRPQTSRFRYLDGVYSAR